MVCMVISVPSVWVTDHSLYPDVCTCGARYWVVCTSVLPIPGTDRVAQRRTVSSCQYSYAELAVLLRKPNPTLQHRIIRIFFTGNNIFIWRVSFVANSGLGLENCRRAKKYAITRWVSIKEIQNITGEFTIEVEFINQPCNGVQTSFLEHLGLKTVNFVFFHNKN
jgi:hypothetical protein